MTNAHDFDITTHAGFASSIFRVEPVSKNARFIAYNARCNVFDGQRDPNYQKHKNAENSASQQVSPYRLLTQKTKFQFTPEKS